MSKIIVNSKRLIKASISHFKIIRSVHIYEKRERRILKNLGKSMKKAPGEEEYLEYWKPVLKLKTPYAFRLYGQFCNYDRRVLSQTVTNIINGILNPKRYSGYLSDKNNFDLYLGEKYFPATIVRKIGGGGIIVHNIN